LVDQVLIFTHRPTPDILNFQGIQTRPDQESLRIPEEFFCLLWSVDRSEPSTELNHRFLSDCSLSLIFILVRADHKISVSHVLRNQTESSYQQRVKPVRINLHLKCIVLR